MEKIFLSIFSFRVEMNTNSPDLAAKLRKDFSFFALAGTEKGEPGPPHYRFNIFQGTIPWEKLPPLHAKRQSVNSITYDQGKIRYNDYYGEALSIYDYRREQAEIYSENPDLLHEITYLLILSRTGKRMDLKGLHKIHAFAVANENANFLTMMPMKGGKTTLFMGLLQDPSLKIISDDEPIIDRRGNIHPFPLRIGVENIGDPSKELPYNTEQVYQIHRRLYGKKHLIPISALKGQVARPCPSRKNILCLGIRTSSPDFKMVRVKKGRMLSPLMYHMVIGIGLPLILE